jgi:hypothetical protein
MGENVMIYLARNDGKYIRALSFYALLHRLCVEFNKVCGYM